MRKKKILQRNKDRKKISCRAFRREKNILHTRLPEKKKLADQKSPTPPPQELNGRPLMKLISMGNSLSWMFWSIYAGLLTNFLSSTCFKYQIGLIETLVDMIFKINTTTTGREKDLQQLSITLQRNSFPCHLIDKIIKRYKNKFSSRPTLGKTLQVFDTSNCHLWVISLPSHAKN